MQKKKRNHFVPQSYMRTFAADSARKKVWTLRKNGGEFELRSIKKVAVSFYLYAPDGASGRDYSFEDKLSSLENLFGGWPWTEIANDYVNLGDDTIRKAVSLLTAVMYLRNPGALDVHRDLHRRLRASYEDYSEPPTSLEINGKIYEVDPSDWPQFRDATEDDVKRMWLSEVGSATWLAEIMMSMRWSIIFSDEPVFITSDNPVNVFHPSLNFRGFGNPDSTVSFPLSPTRILCLDNRHTEPCNQYYPLKIGAGSINALTWRNSINYVFSHRHTGIVCQEMCDDAERMGFRWQPGGWFQTSEVT